MRQGGYLSGVHLTVDMIRETIEEWDENAKFWRKENLKWDRAVERVFMRFGAEGIRGFKTSELWEMVFNEMENAK